MAFLGGNDLKSLLLRNKIIVDCNGVNLFDSRNIKQAAYELSLGSEVFRTDNKDKKTEYLDEKNKYIDINPGQFTLLMTDEFINIPDDKLAFISIKAKQKLKGLINVSGFHVDPGFRGKLLFSVYNAGPSVITLETKKKYFLVWFSDLKNNLDSEYLYNKDNHHQGQSTIDPEYLSALKKDEMTSPHSLLQRIKDLETDISIKIEDKNRKILSSQYLRNVLIGVGTAILIRILFAFDFGTIELFFNNDLRTLQTKIDSVDSKNKEVKKDLKELEKKYIYLYKNRIEKN